MQDTDLVYTLGSLPLCPVEDIFLCRLVQKDSIEASSNDEITNYVEKALALRQSYTLELLKLIEDTIDAQREKTENIAQILHGQMSSEGQVFMCYLIVGLYRSLFGFLVIKMVYNFN